MAKTRSGKIATILSDPMWQGIAAVTAIVALFLTVIVWRNPVPVEPNEPVHTPHITSALPGVVELIGTNTPAPGTKLADIHGIVQVYVPAGCFMIGSDPAKDRYARLEEQPQHRVCMAEGYWLDAYEVTNAAYQQFIDAGGYTTRDYWLDAGWQWKQSSYITEPANLDGFTDSQQPRVGVSWYEAEAYAKWRGGRLPTEAEWEYAARGLDSLTYPWGNTWNSGTLNSESALGKTTPVGSYESGKSWVGAYDLAGNAWEWAADWYSDSYYQQRVKDDPTGPENGQLRVVRGGSWLYTQMYARAACRKGFFPTDRDNNVGFRIIARVRP
jgi:formylglycine-generating enzyme required for sulfatase activity